MRIFSEYCSSEVTGFLTIFQCVRYDLSYTRWLYVRLDAHNITKTDSPP